MNFAIDPLVTALLMVLPLALVIDFMLFGRMHREISVRQALGWSLGWVCASLIFATIVWQLAGAKQASLFVSVYVLEKSLSVDNLLVFSALLTAHHVSFDVRQRVLTWGIALALVLRSGMLVAGYALIQLTPLAHFAFGALLVGAGITVARRQLVEAADGGELSTRAIRNPSPPASTRLLVGLLISIALADLLFALDSIPAAFAITTDPAIIFCANVFALLGLRALYFVLEHVLQRMRYVQTALGIALTLIGLRMILDDKLPLPHWAPALVTATLVFGAMLTSILHDRHRRVTHPNP